MKLVKFLSIFIFISLVSPSLQAEDTTLEFKPAWWCRGAHLQTIYGGLLRSKPDLPLRPERLETPDGDFIDVNWLDGNKNAPLIVILHGLGSSANSSYVLSILDRAHKAGWRAVAINARGSQQPNRLIKTAHGGRTEDLDSVLNYLINTQKSDKIYLVGYSLGGNIVLKWLGEKGESAPKEVIKAAVVSVPYDLEKAAYNLDRGFNREVYTRFLLNHLKVQALDKARRFPGALDFEKVKNARTFKVYDHEVTARLNGFKDEHDYWAQSSSVNYLNHIKIPVLLIHAANDPFLPKKDLPLEKISQSSHLKLVLTSDGGHMGFISGKIPFHPDSWLEQTMFNFFES